MPHRLVTFEDLGDELAEAFEALCAEGHSHEWLVGWLDGMLTQLDFDHPGFARWFQSPFALEPARP